MEERFEEGVLLGWSIDKSSILFKEQLLERASQGERGVEEKVASRKRQQESVSQGTHPKGHVVNAIMKECCFYKLCMIRRNACQNDTFVQASQ